VGFLLEHVNVIPEGQVAEPLWVCLGWNELDPLVQGIEEIQNLCDGLESDGKKSCQLFYFPRKRNVSGAEGDGEPSLSLSAATYCSRCEQVTSDTDMDVSDTFLFKTAVFRA